MSALPKKLFPDASALPPPEIMAQIRHNEPILGKLEQSIEMIGKRLGTEEEKSEDFVKIRRVAHAWRGLVHIHMMAAETGQPVTCDGRSIVIREGLLEFIA